MQKSIIRKNLVYLVIILFIGIAVAPSVTSVDISKNNASDNNGLIEITVELCKPNGIEEHQIFITKDQNEKLEELFQGFKEDLNKAETREETIRLYSDMVVSLDEIGLIPEGSSCEEVQELVTVENRINNPEKMKSNKYLNMVFERFKDKNSKQHYLKNRFCQIAARTSSSYQDSFVLTLTRNFPITSLFLFWLEFFCWFFSQINRYPIGYTIGIGYYYEISGYVGFKPSSGWINTDGYDGKQVFEGEGFYGNLPMCPITYLHRVYYPGIFGFTGITYYYDHTFLSYFVGKAIWVKIGPNLP